MGSWHVGVVESSLLCHSSSFFLREFGVAGIFPGNKSVRDISVWFLWLNTDSYYFPLLFFQVVVVFFFKNLDKGALKIQIILSDLGVGFQLVTCAFKYILQHYF